MSRVIELRGKRVVDADYRMALKIEPQDVKDGDSKQPNTCAAALACVRQLDAISAQVHLSRVYVEFPKRWLRFKTPTEMRDQIIKFDRAHDFKPGTYLLMPLSPSERVIGVAQHKGGGGKNKPKKHRAKPHHVDNVRYASNFRRERTVKGA